MAGDLRLGLVKPPDMTHKQLVDVAYRWLISTVGCGFALKELVTSGWETPDAIGFRSGMSILVEVKTSRSDFFADRKKPFRLNPTLGMGQFRFFCCPTGLIQVSELPERWGLVYVDEKGKPSCVHNPYIVQGRQPCFWVNGFESYKKAEVDMLYSALRRVQSLGLLEHIYKK